MRDISLKPWPLNLTELEKETLLESIIFTSPIISFLVLIIAMAIIGEQPLGLGTHIILSIVIAVISYQVLIAMRVMCRYSGIFGWHIPFESEDD